MNKIVWLFLLAVLGFFAITNSAWSYPIADTLRYPLDSYVVGANHFGAYGLVRKNKWHLGEDVAATAGNNVFVAGDGIVRRAQIQNGYGGMYIIEHNINGEILCALYVHMNLATFTKNAGQEVVKGECLGQVGNSSQNGGWPEHFHFGIRKGAYPADPNAYVYGDWIFSGYTAEESVLNGWYNPSDFISQHNQPSIGRCQNNTICQPILDCYNSNGGLQTFGNPVSITFDGLSQPATVWPYWSCYFQVFNGGDLGECAIVYDYRASPNQAFAVQNKLWHYYQAHSGPFMLLDGNYLGGPVDREVYATNNHNGHQMSVQRMAHGYLVYDPVTAFTDAVTDSSSFTIADVGGPDFNMAIIPGPTSQLVLTATALSCSTVQLAFNDVGASEYWVYQNGQYRLALSGTSVQVATAIDSLFQRAIL